MESPPSMEDVPRSSIDSSPEFEFWVVGNHSPSPDPNILTADELFVDGVLRPLRPHSLAAPAAPVDPSASICSPATPPSASKRWKDIFKKSEKKNKDNRSKGIAGGSAELSMISNMIWPFSRSRSAGNATRHRAAAPAAARKTSSAPCSRSNSRGDAAAASRKTSSAPCSRSNSRGESSKPLPSAARRWAASPGRPGLSGGVHLGRNIPVWQPRRTAKAGESAAAASGGGGGARPRVLSLNVNTCIGYGNPVTCRSGGGFNLRTIFSKKIH